MGKQITSGAFQILNRALGLSGEGAQTTELDDGFVSQVLPVGEIAAYSLSKGQNVGIVASLLRNGHAAAGDITETMDPYNPATRLGQFQVVDFSEFDMWYMGSGVFFTSTQTSIDECQVGINAGAGIHGMSEGIVTARHVILSRWNDDGIVDCGLGLHMVKSETGEMFQFVKPFLWPRSNLFVCASQTTGAGASTIDFTSIWAMVNRGFKPSAF